jgi:hypothetical protein
MEVRRLVVFVFDSTSREGQKQVKELKFFCYQLSTL